MQDCGIGFQSIPHQYLILPLTGVAASALLFLVLSSKKPPHWSIQGVLVPITFLMSIIWLYIVANEVVSVLRSLGLLLGIDTGMSKHTLVTYIANCICIGVGKLGGTV